MDEREFIQQVGQSWVTIKEKLGIDRSLLLRTSLRVDAEFNHVALDPNSSYDEIYRTGLSRSHYNILLKDYSYLQFTYTNEHAWRLAYYPNPRVTGVPEALEYLTDLERQEGLGLLSHEEVSDLLAEMPSVHAVPAVRYEYAKSQYREFAHPASHFHVGRDTQNRWPCSIALGPIAFVLFIVKLYYPAAWEPWSAYHGAETDDCVEEKFISVITRCNSVQDFSESERRSFHLGKNMIGAPTPVSEARRPNRR